MSMKWVALAMDHGPAIRSDRLLFLALADRADADGVCWPARADLCKRAAMSVSTLTRALRRLEAAGWVQRSRRFNTSNLFRLNLFRLLEAEAAVKAVPAAVGGFEPFPEEAAARARRAQAVEKKGLGHSDPGSGHGDPGSGQFAAPNLSRTSQEPKKAREARFSGSSEGGQAFKAWLSVAPRGWTFSDFKAWQAKGAAGAARGA